MDAMGLQSGLQKSKPRSVFYRLRIPIILILLASGGATWTALRIRQANRQEAAVEALRKAGWVVWYDYDAPLESLCPT